MDAALPLSDEIIPAAVIQATLDRTVLLLDDILDEGRKLATIRTRLLEQGAVEVLTAAYALKERAAPAAIAADFTGVRVPNPGRWRNLPSIRTP